MSPERYRRVAQLDRISDNGISDNGISDNGISDNGIRDGVTA
jgi:hypothetical protein